MVVLFIFKEIKFVDNSFTNITFKYDSHFVEHFFFLQMDSTMKSTKFGDQK